jgi:4-amino-4-deoxy-L-arabinose transferase-like glycosyltransferase
MSFAPETGLTPRAAAPTRKRPMDAVLAAPWLFVIAAIGIQLRMGLAVWGSDPATADEPAHFVTGVMVYDYLRHALFSNPLAFAQSFYVRYPKVAFGHWPPLYYILQAAWFFVAPPTIESARLLSAVIGGGIAAILFLRLRRLHGPLVGALSGACFLMLPLVQTSAWMVMSDLAVALFMLLAVIAFADFLELGRTRHVAWFAAWSTLAILTKGNAWALGPFALLAPLIARRFRVFRDLRYLLSGVVIAGLAAPFYIWSRSVQLGYPADVTSLASRASAVTYRLSLLAPFLRFVPAVVLIVALAGAVSLWFKPFSTVEASALALVLAQCLFMFVLPLIEENRYYMPSAAALLILFGRGMTLAGKRAGPVAIAAACFAFCGITRPVHVDGYRAAANAIPYESRGTTILVGSDAAGEGAFIAERLERDAERAGVILRGTKALASVGWSGARYRLLFQTPAEVVDYLQSVPVRYILIDQASASRAHRELLETAVLSAPEIFRLQRRLPISGRKPGDILIFENPSAAGKPAFIHVPVGSRSVEYRLK